ncbi:MAG: helix-turn-helix transcriptional regulator [Clostridia bacterium]|nr:helix-turn-helix transcriptional regulator [Clostridia bacterium]
MKYVKRIKDTRIDNDKVQEDLAKVLEITKQQYSLYETGKRKIPIDKFIKLCEYYNLSSDYLLGLSDEPKALK